MTHHPLAALPVIMLCALPSPALAQDDGSAWSFSLDSVTVRGHRYTSPIRGGSGVTLWDMSRLDDLPLMLGNADPVHYAQMLPGIQTNSEYRSGINIEGCDNQHNMVTIGGVPIYNVNHLLGFFSTFNAAHFPTLSIARSTAQTAANRLGGQLDMLPPAEHPDSLNGSLSVGLIASQATLRLPLGGRTHLAVSLRGSYMNLLYSQWMKDGDNQVHYSFHDANATLVHRLDSRHTLLLDFYSGSDHGDYTQELYLADMNARWGNTMGALHWRFQGKDTHAETTLYATSYHNTFGLAMQEMSFRLPSGITDVGLKSQAEWHRWSGSAEAVWHHIRPQSLERSGHFNATDGHTAPTDAVEATAGTTYHQPLTPVLTLAATLRASLFRQRHATYGAADPALSLVYDDHTVQLSASYALRHQYLFLAGFSDMGLPTEFWLPAAKGRRPQYAHAFTLGAASFLFRRRYRLSADLSYRRLHRQLEYGGSVLDLVNTAYDLDRQLLNGQGENYSLSLMLNKCAGRLTGWLSYTYTRASRTFTTDRGRQEGPASHERPHELDAVATCTLNRHWSLGSTLVYASGTPFTAAQELYLLNGNIIMHYGRHHGARLKPYARLDLSANYKWHSRRLAEQGINLSVYNATSHRNELFYYLKTRDDGTFAYRPVSFVLRILPSVCYFCKF